MTKTEIGIMKSETNLKTSNSKRYDLEDRLLEFARSVRTFVKKLPQSTATREDAKQLVRSSGSVGANYLEANESLSKKDFLMRVKISKKEARETIWWLELIEAEGNLVQKKQSLIRECTEIMNILGAILRNSQ